MHGDWGRDLVLYLARRRSGLSLKEIGDKADGLDYKVVGKAVQRFAKKLERDRSLKRVTSECLDQLSYVETWMTLICYMHMRGPQYALVTWRAHQSSFQGIAVTLFVSCWRVGHRQTT